MTHRDKKRVLAITVASPLTQNIYDRIGAEVISEYFDVVIFDCLDWVRRYDKKPVYDQVAAANIHQVVSRSAFREAFRLTSPAFVLDFVGRGKFTRQIQEVCREFGALYITHLLTPFPNPISRKTLWRSFVSEPVATSTKVLRYILRQFREDNPLPPDVALLAGSESNNAWTDLAKKKIFTATPNYFELRRIEQSLAASKNPSAGFPRGDYILFIDDCLALSFDFVLGTHKPIIEPDEYFPVLNSFFDRLEDHFRMPVVVAAHPNGKEFDNYQELFGNRAVLFDATGELCVKCRFAMTHFSSAITYPVLLRKRIVLLNLKPLKNQPQGVAINYLAEELQCVQMELAGDVEESKLEKLRGMSVNEVCYKTFEEKYISNVATQDANPFESLMRYLTSVG